MRRYFMAELPKVLKEMETRVEYLGYDIRQPNDGRLSQRTRR